MTVNREYVCWSLGTKPLRDLGTNLLPCGNQSSYPVTNQVQRNHIQLLQIKPVEVPHAYAYITETKNIESNKDSKISKIVLEIQKQDPDISRNNLKLVQNNENNNIYDNVVNIINTSSNSIFYFSDEYNNEKFDNLILKLTNQVRRNIKSAKEDFDNFIKHMD